MERISVEEMIAKAKCKASGTGMSVDSRCPECKGVGWVTKQCDSEMYAAYVDKTEEFAEPCPRCAPRRWLESAWHRAGIPNVFTGLMLDGFHWAEYPRRFQTEVTEAQKRIQAFVGRFAEFSVEGMGLFIHSKTMGSGKTRLACCIAGELMEKQRIGAHFVSVSMLLDAIQNNERHGDFMGKLISTPLLVLDDVGAKRTGVDWLNDELFRLVDGRSQQHKPTVFTSNFTVSELPLDGRVAERINHDSLLVRLPEYCVRSEEARRRKEELLKGNQKGESNG